MADWQDCPECGASVKADNLTAHKARVHGGRMPRKQGPRQPVRTGTAIAITAVLLVVFVAWMLVRLGDESTADIEAEGEPYWGDADAPLTVYLFADYQCPHCAAYETDGPLDRFLTTWVEPGDVRLVYKDLVIVGDDSTTAAEASQVVWALVPDRWPEWNRFVFERQGPERSGWASEQGMIALTQEWGGVDMAVFTARLQDQEFGSEVAADGREAREAGIASTPTMLVGAQRLNPHDEGAVHAAITDALEDAG